MTIEIGPGDVVSELIEGERAIQLSDPASTAGILRVVARRFGAVDSAVPTEPRVDSELRVALGAILEADRATRKFQDRRATDGSTAAHERLRPGVAQLARGATVREAAASTGMHRVAFGRSFKAHFGKSPTEYRRRRQVAAAAAALLETRLDVAAIAYDTGFADQSHLIRAFRRETGLTPGRYRALLGCCFAAR